MPTCPRCAAVALLLLFVAFAGCDTNNGSSRTLDELDGTYTITELRFVPEADQVAPANVLGRLDSSATQLEIFAADSEAELRTSFRGEGRTRTSLTVRTLSNALEFTAVTSDDEDELERLFLPRTFRLAFTSPEARELRASPALFLTANLQRFDPDGYRGLTAVQGRLSIAYRRR